MIIELFFNRSVINSDLAAVIECWFSRSFMAARSLFITDQIYNSSRTQNLGLIYIERCQDQRIDAYIIIDCLRTGIPYDPHIITARIKIV
jgi:hypothetical protein